MMERCRKGAISRENGAKCKGEETVRKFILVISRIEKKAAGKEGCKSKRKDFYRFALFLQRTTCCL